MTLKNKLLIVVLTFELGVYAWTHRQRLGLCKPHVIVEYLSDNDIRVHVDRLEPGVKLELPPIAIECDVKDEPKQQV